MSGRYQQKPSFGSSERWNNPGTPYMYHHKFNAGVGVGEVEIVFPSLCKSMTVVNQATNSSGSVMRLHTKSRTGNTAVVAADGTGYNFRLAPGEAFSFDIRTPRVFVSVDDLTAASEFSLYAEMSGIKNPDFALTGSGVG